MQLAFPLTLTWAQIAALPKAADHFCWDESMLEDDEPDTELEGMIAAYSEAFTASPKLAVYLGMIGYELTYIPVEGAPSYATGITIRSETALLTAHALFNQICHEYDEPDCPRIEYTTPTWALFELGGDDYVDYCGSQPSCLTALLIEEHNS